MFGRRQLDPEVAALIRQLTAFLTRAELLLTAYALNGKSPGSDPLGSLLGNLLANSNAQPKPPGTDSSATR